MPVSACSAAPWRAAPASRSTPTGARRAARARRRSTRCRSRARRRRAHRRRREMPSVVLGHTEDPPGDLLLRPGARADASVYSAFALRPELADCANRVDRTASAEGRALRQPVGEEERELALRARPRVGAVDEVVRHRGREIAADRARRRVGRVRRAHQSCARGDRILARGRRAQHGPGGDEVDELAEEGLARVLGVVLSRELRDDRQEPRAAQLEAAALEARHDLAGEAAPDGVGLDQDECGLDAPSAAESSRRGSVRRRRVRRTRAASSRSSPERPPGGTGVSQYGHTCQSASSGEPARDARLLQPRRADRADEEDASTSPGRPGSGGRAARAAPPSP